MCFMYVCRYMQLNRSLRMKLKLLLISLLVAALLAGCSNAPTVVVSTPAPAVETPAPTPSPTPEPTPSPTPEPTPSPTPDPYFPDEEEMTVDLDDGYWLYRSPSLYVEVNRYANDVPQTYFVAEVRMKDTETERGGFSRPDRPGGKSIELYKIAQYYKAVIAVNGDFLDHHPEDPKGVIIRDGEVFVDDDENQTLAFYPDGTMRVFEAGETTADQLLADGVKNAFSFGPAFIKDGEIQPGLMDLRLSSPKPRTAVGMIEPYHFILVQVEGRSKRSDGMTYEEMADLFASYGCQVAYNLDGGQSATITFMGENINEYQGSLTGQRPVPDALMFGYSELVGKEEE